MKTNYPMTREGKKELEKELHQLKTLKRNDIKKKMKEARSFCDFSEDVTYKELLFEQEKSEERIIQLEKVIDNAKIVDNSIQSHAIGIGSTIVIKDRSESKEETFTILGTTESNPTEGILSIDSPLAKGLLGHCENDVVTIKTPIGEREIEILSIKSCFSK